MNHFYASRHQRQLFGASVSVTNRLSPRLLTTSALTSVAMAAMFLTAAPGYAQDSGTTCTMVGPACSMSSTGAPGADGPGSGTNGSGKAGFPGQPSGDISATLQTTRTLGSSDGISPLNVLTMGGKGGDGSDSDATTIIPSLSGGDGAPGQNGGAITITTGSAITGKADTTDILGNPASGITLISLGGEGGVGGVASYNSGQMGNGHPGAGGTGGSVTASIGGTWSSAGTGLYAISNGGQGGTGKSRTSSPGDDNYSPQGVDACYRGADDGLPNCTAGAGNTVNVTISGSVAGENYGAFIASVGGDGGVGGSSIDCCTRTGGHGGDAGDGGTVTATLASSGIAIASQPGAAFYVASIGGRGGVGGTANSSGKGGAGGNGGNVTAEIDGNVSTSGNSDTYGALIQSLGGTGGNGGTSGAWFNPVSGDGNSGGSAGSVTVTGTGATIVTRNVLGDGANSSALVAQSIGGGGGVGPDSTGWFAMGGNGGIASNGNTVSVSLTDSSVATFGFNSAAILAQSIGGGGGKGGDTTSSGYIVNMTVGGSGGAGGSAMDANAMVLGKSKIQTINQHSNALEIQSIGGGGGDGGSAYGKVSSVFYGASISVGGSGGAGGNGGTVNAARVENVSPDSQLLTFDASSFGMVGQSIGGGGGNGGASTSKSITKSSGNYPSQSLAMATGGSGGVAGNGDNVYLQSSGLIGTIGPGSVGVMAQSIGGGGGNAGDASASASATGGRINLSVSLALGGSGGAGGNGGNAEVTNHGLVVTTGGSATGVMVQSIGGGGGNAGAGDAKATAPSDIKQGGDDDDYPGGSLSFAVGSGGSGGGAGTGANATATNTGAILTLGDAAHGILAQTIGGGGGNGGGGAASTQGNLQFDLRVGGTGGNGGNTYYTGQVNVDNSGTIVTYGADASGILAQSIAGGGGTGGKAGTSLSGGTSDSAGGNGTSTGVQTTLGAIEQNYANKGGDAIGDYNYLGDKTHGALGTINGLLGAATVQSKLLGDDGDDLDDTAGSGGDDSDSNQAKSIHLGVSLGGNGGSGGAAGYITVTNEASATVATLGKQSDAIVAQSIGGGGGKGGNASTASSGDLSGEIGVGGNGGNNGFADANNGGQPTVNNHGLVYTIGAMSSGIVAQSIGGGGGIGGTSSVTVGTSSNDRSYAASVALGGLATKSNGISEIATVNSDGAIETRGHDSIGIIVQSISGGGGIVKSLATDLDKNNSSSVTTTGSSSQKDFKVNAKLGADGTLVSGNAGPAYITTSGGGTITTRGDDAIGILAQNVAGGGGLVQGGKPNGSSAADFLGAGDKTGTVTPNSNTDSSQGVHVTVGANITTGFTQADGTVTGNGAAGVFAQSVGGSGGIAGDIGHTMQLSNIGKTSNSGQYNGNGGDVFVTVQQGATIKTIGGNAPGIVAQTVGGGGGWFTNEDYAYIGSAGGTGIGGLIFVNVQGVIDANGGASAGIFAQSAGGATNGGAGAGNNISITIGNQSNPCTNPYAACAAAVFGGNGFGAIASAVYVRNGGAGNVVNNYGVVNTHESNDGYAFYADNAVLTVNNYGIVTGNTNIAGNFHTYGGGSYVPLSTVNLGSGTLINEGTLDIGGTKTSKVTLIGNYAGSGRIAMDADFVGGKSDQLAVTGTARISGSITVNPSTMRNAKLALVSAGGGVTLDPQLAATPTASQLFTFRFDSDGKTLYATPQAQLAQQANGLGNAKTAVAGHLQTLFDSGKTFDQGFTALSKLASSAQYVSALDSLTGKALGGIAAYRYQASRRFVSDVNGSCATDGDDSCGWARVQAGRTTQDATVDALGYKATYQIFEMGAQTRIGGGFYAGGALAYEHSKLRDADRTGRVHGDTMLAALGIRYRPGGLELIGSLDGGYGWYGSNRVIRVGAQADTAKANPKVWNIGVDFAASYTVPLGRNGYLKPFAEVRGTDVHGDGFTEDSASPFALAVGSQSNFAVSGTIGAALGGSIGLGHDTRLKPFVSAAIEFAGNTDWKTSASFAGESGTDPFIIQTRAPGTFGRLGVGATLASGAKFDLTLSYNPEVGSHYNTQQGVARLTYRF